MENKDDRATVKETKARKCAEWLAYCLDIGWEKKDVPALEKLWMDSHDDKGNYRRQKPNP